jgi:hypothetical protein
VPITHHTDVETRPPRKARATRVPRRATLLDRLDGMSRAEWLALGRQAQAESVPVVAERPRAEAELASVVAAHGLAVRAWLLRDDVETLACLANCAHDARTGRSYEAPCTDAERALFAAAGRVAARAALAELARPWLGARAYELLVAPLAVVARDGRG